MNKKGFTLIELLIVIVIIGILAVAVLSAINPIEQRNKATDTALRSDSAEVLNAIERYYASKGEYPWVAMGNSSPGTTLVSGSNPADWLGNAATPSSSDPDSLVGSDELKAEFLNRNSLSSLGISVSGGLVTICYPVNSNQFQSETAKLKNIDGTDHSGTISTGNPAYRCVPE